MASAPRKMAGEGGLAGCLEALESQANGPLRHLTARELAVMASVSKGFHGGFDYSHMRGLVAGYISDVLEECELTSHSRTDHGEPWVSYYRVLAPLVVTPPDLGDLRRRLLLQQRQLDDVRELAGHVARVARLARVAHMARVAGVARESPV